MGTNVILISSDGVRYQIDRQMLCNSCPAFATLLPDDIGAHVEHQVEENSEVLRILFDVLKEGRREKFKQWELTVIARLGQEYRSKILLLTAKAQLIYHMQNDPYAAFCLATDLNDVELVECIAKLRLAKDDPTPKSIYLYSDWDCRYEKYCKAHVVLLRNTLLYYSLGGDGKITARKPEHLPFRSGLDLDPSRGLPSSLATAVAKAAYDATPGGSPLRLLQPFMEELRKQSEPSVTLADLEDVINLMEETFRKEVARIKF